MGASVREIQLRHAKAPLSAVVDDAARGEPSIITPARRPQAVVLSRQHMAWIGVRYTPYRRVLLSQMTQDRFPPLSGQRLARSEHGG